MFFLKLQCPDGLFPERLLLLNWSDMQSAAASTLSAEYWLVFVWQFYGIVSVWYRVAHCENTPHNNLLCVWQTAQPSLYISAFISVAAAAAVGRLLLFQSDAG